MKFLFLTIITLCTINISYAQNGPQLTLKAPPAHIKIDGDIKEWGDSLTYYSTEDRLNYMIANSNDTLYLAVKIYDNNQIAQVLNAGLTFSIDPRGKKKSAFSLTYPVNIGGTGSLYGHKQDQADGVTQADRDELMREKITTLRGIKVLGFKDIEDDMITTSNTYGIQTAVDYDAVGNLIYEEAIPLKFFHADLSSKNEWAFNIKINGIARQPKAEGEEGQSGGGHHGEGGGGMGGGGGRGGGGHHNNNNYMGGPDPMTKSVDFWGKFTLAK
jgi:uncharacterized membrane protein YgcG